MKIKWTKERIDDYVENECGGCAVGLVEVFPFSKTAKERIKRAFADEENYTDSDYADLILELAYEAVA